MTETKSIVAILAGLAVIIAMVITAVTYFNALESRVAKLEELPLRMTEAERRIDDLADESFDAYVDRRWCDVKAKRALATEFANDTGLPIEVAVSVGGKGNTGRCRLDIRLDGETVVYQENNNDDWNKVCAATVTVPAGASYWIGDKVHDGDAALNMWWELRSSCP